MGGGGAQSCIRNIEIMLRMYLCMMVTNCAGERSFSKLRRIKNAQRTTMGEKRLNMLMSIECELLRTVDTTSTIKDFAHIKSRERERNVLFNDALNTFYLRLYGVRHMVKDHSDSEKETRCRHIGYSYRLTARVLLYAPSHRQDNTYHGLCYTSRGALAGTRNSSMGPPHEGSIRRPTAP